MSTSRGRWQSQRVRLENATLALGHSRRGHAVLAHELRVDESLVGCLLRPEDVGAGAPRPLERLPTPTYCDVTGASCETYDLNDKYQHTTSAGVELVILAAESAIKREWAKLSSARAGISQCCGSLSKILRFQKKKGNMTQNFGEFAASKCGRFRDRQTTNVPTRSEGGQSLLRTKRIYRAPRRVVSLRSCLFSRGCPACSTPFSAGASPAPAHAPAPHRQPRRGGKQSEEI